MNTLPFHKFISSDSFSVPDRANWRFRKQALGRGVYHLSACPLDNPETKASELKALSFSPRHNWSPEYPDPLEIQLNWDHKGLELHWKDQAILKTMDGRGFRTNNEAWLLSFKYSEAMRFYGLGEKTGPLEKTGEAFKFWNTDVMGEFASSQLETAQTDPLYISIPWLMLYHKQVWIGLLLDNYSQCFMHLNKEPRFFSPEPRNNGLLLGSQEGPVSLFVFTAASAKELHQTFQLFTGCHPRPPLWALGHQQCKWGYDSLEDLEKIAQGFEQRHIPNSGLWLDIGYMDHFKVFSFDPEHFSQPKTQISRFKTDHAMKLVPILDPGVKLEPGYPVYESGLKADIFCKTSEGSPYVGYVWPGETVFPDFSLDQGRKWWAEHCTDFASMGIDGAWLDMNDPSTGSAGHEAMRFQNAREPHSFYHNRYALGMAQASFEGFSKAQENIRGFLLSRSAFTGQAPYSAVWLGDNISSWTYLQTMIPMSLNLGLSGIPFNGPDAPGFAGTPSRKLAREWYKAQFLFPFFRNHSVLGSPPQEPWAFDSKTSALLIHYIRLRYKLIPYLYQNFLRHEKNGEALLKPLWYEDPAVFDQGADRISDQFLCGSAVMQAPFTQDFQKKRAVLIPSGYWMDAHDGRWIQGPARISKSRNYFESPLWFKASSIVPCQIGVAQDSRIDPYSLEFHCFLNPAALPQKDQPLQLVHYFDDGETLNYRTEAEQRLEISLYMEDTDVVTIDVSFQGLQSKPKLSFVFYHKVSAIKVRSKNASALSLDLKPLRAKQSWTSLKGLRVWKSLPFELPLS